MANPCPPPGTTAVMILRNSGKGDYEIYAIGNNSLLAAYFLGQVGLDWQPAGGLADVDSQSGVRLNDSSKTSLARFNDSDTSDMMPRNVRSGKFEVYEFRNNGGGANARTTGADPSQRQQQLQFVATPQHA